MTLDLILLSATTDQTMR